MPKGMPRARHPEMYGGLKPNTASVQQVTLPEPPEPTGPDPTVPEPVQIPAEDDTPEGTEDDADESEVRSRVKELEARLAELQAAIAAGERTIASQNEATAEPEIVYEQPKEDGDNILIHILEDGFTALGQVWYRGQELEFTPGSPAHRDTFDRTGKSWLDLRGNDFAQVERWGKVMFRPGPWPGKTLLDGKGQFDPLKSLSGDGVVPAPGEQELAEAAAAEAKRKRAAPRLPMR